MSIGATIRHGTALPRRADSRRDPRSAAANLEGCSAAVPPAIGTAALLECVCREWVGKSERRGRGDQAKGSQSDGNELHDEWWLIIGYYCYAGLIVFRSNFRIQKGEIGNGQCPL